MVNEKIVYVLVELYPACEDTELHDQLAPCRRHQRRGAVRPQGVAT